MWHGRSQTHALVVLNGSGPFVCRCATKGDELALRSGHRRLPLCLSNGQPRGHDAGSLVEIVQGISLVERRSCACSLEKAEVGSDTTTATRATGSPGDPSVAPPARSSLLRFVLRSSRFFVSSTSTNRSVLAISRSICRACRRRHRRLCARRSAALGVSPTQVARRCSTELEEGSAQACTTSRLMLGCRPVFPRGPTAPQPTPRVASVVQRLSAVGEVETYDVLALTCQRRSSPRNKQDPCPPLDIFVRSESENRHDCIAVEVAECMLRRPRLVAGGVG